MGHSGPQPGLDPLPLTQPALSTLLEPVHPLSPTAAPLYASGSRRSPSTFALPLADDTCSSSHDRPDLATTFSGGKEEAPNLPAGVASKSAPQEDGIGDSKVRANLVLDALFRDELEVAKRRYDLMDDEEIRRILDAWGREREEGTKNTIARPGQQVIPDEEPDAATKNLSAVPTYTLSRNSVLRFPSPGTEQTEAAEVSQSPLFPPSPPSQEPFLGGDLGPSLRGTDHPLRIMAKAVLELQETVARLREENEELRLEISRESRRRQSATSAMNVHDDLNEAISTSLTSGSVYPVSATQSGRFPDPPRIPSPTPSSSSQRPLSVKSHYRDNASVKSVDIRTSVNGRASFSTAPLPSNRSVRSIEVGDGASSPGKTPIQARKRDAARSSWTSSLWGWGGNGSGRKAERKDRQGSISSLRGEIRSNDVAVTTGEDDGDEHAWRKGDGSSPPAFRAVFLATRLVTPDPLSILANPQIASNSLIAYLAHSLVSHARDEGIAARDPPGTRRRLSKESRGRAVSLISQESRGSNIEEAGREKTYGETLAATALYGRSFLSTTIRAGNSGKAYSIPGMGEGGDTTRPSLLSRTSARTFPTTALCPSIAGDSAAKQEEEDETPLPSVEMASITAGENQPPTVLLSRQHLGLYFQSSKDGKGRTVETASRFKGVEPPLTDRYGFIYDIQHASMLKDASVAGVPAPASLSGVIPGVGKVEDGEGWIERRRRASHEPVRPDIGSRQSTSSAGLPNSSSVSSGTTTPARTSSSSQIPSSTQSSEPRNRSSTLILNPSPARPVTAKDNLTVSARGASSLRSVASPLSTPLLDPISTSVAVSRVTVSSLLDQLTELHDRQQAERRIEWDAWLAKRKRKRAGSASTKTGTKGETGWGGDMIGISQMGLGDAEEWRAFAKLVRHGIPLAYRPDVWAECSGAKDALVPGEYREILTVHDQDRSPVLSEIEKDVSRTFPGNMFFGGDGPGVAKLRRVLVAYSWRNPRVGYCQGMNMLAATLLLTHTDEEQAFWVLSAMIDRLLPTDFYSPSLLASRADQLVLADLVEVHLPRIAAALAELGVDLASITFGWFLSLFTDCLPVETLFRVWDVFFVEGHDTLFRVALAILKLHEAEICAAEDAGDLFTFVAGMTSRLWAADKLISTQHAYRPSVRHADIAGRYGKHLASLQEP